MFSSKGSAEPSIMTEVKPSWMARMMLSMLSPWSMWMTKGTGLLEQRATMYFTKSSLQYASSVGCTAMIAGASISSAVSTTVRNRLLSETL